MTQSRTEMAAKNILWGYINTIATTILKFVCRWAFIHTFGITFLGINGLYTSILGVLSLTELGIGTAMNYSLYKPVAERNTEKIKSLMVYYKKAYRYVALVITVLGVALIPFLPKLIKGADGVDHLVLYYVLFLFNTVSSYFVSYKYSLAGADQRNYVVNNINTMATIIMNILQIIALFVFRSFLVYLIIQIVSLLFSKVYASVYLDKMYPYLKDKDVQPLDEKSKKRLLSDVRALIVHKLGDVAVNQTDAIIISAAISVAVTGLISNYSLVISTVESVLAILFGSIIGSLGNLCATTSKQKQLDVFKIYDFASFWLFGFASIAYAVLLQSFNVLMWGPEYVVDYKVVLLIYINHYIVGQRIPLSNMKTASGVFQEDKFLPIIQAIVNLVVSIALVKTIGLIGIYIGTLVSGIVPSIIRPIVVYRKMFDQSVEEYFKRYACHFAVIALLGIITYYICKPILSVTSWPRFIAAVFITAILPNVAIFLLYRKSQELSYVLNTIKRLTTKIQKKIRHA